MPDETMVRIDLDFFGAKCISIEGCPIQNGKEYAIINRAIATKWCNDSAELAQVKAERDRLNHFIGARIATGGQQVMRIAEQDAALTAARERIARLEGAVTEAYQTLGPDVPDSLGCMGCAYEWGAALRILKAALSPSTPKEPTL